MPKAPFSFYKIHRTFSQGAKALLQQDIISGLAWNKALLQAGGQLHPRAQDDCCSSNRCTSKTDYLTPHRGVILVFKLRTLKPFLSQLPLSFIAFVVCLPISLTFEKNHFYTTFYQYGYFGTGDMFLVDSLQNNNHREPFLTINNCPLAVIAV